MTSSCLFFEGVAPPLITRFGANPRPVRATPPLTDEESTRFFATLFAAAGLPLVAYRSRALHRRLPACLRFLQVDSVGSARRRLRAEPGLTRAVLNITLLGVSEFFRDAGVFECLDRLVLPSLAERREWLRIWSAGCSGGQELYSVAMQLAECGLLPVSDLLGTDCRQAAVEEARTGVFAWDQLAALTAARRERFFTRVGAAGVVRPALRPALSWKADDLLAHAQPGPWHLILWRNVAIYLESDTAGRVWNSLVAELTPGGYIVVGKADHPPLHPAMTRVSPCIYQKSGGGR